jgi:hypothetical protein
MNDLDAYLGLAALLAVVLTFQIASWIGASSDRRRAEASLARARAHRITMGGCQCDHPTGPGEHEHR